MRGAPSLWRLRLRVPAAALGAFEAALQPFVQSIAIAAEAAGDGRLEVEAVARSRPGEGALGIALALAAAGTGVAPPVAEVAPLAPADWLSESLKAHGPVAAGRYLVHGSHYAGRIPAGRIGITVDAGLAFGSGQHESTRGCLIALDRLARERGRARVRAALDMGCGSGILAAAIAKTWRVPVLACDIDPVAVAVAREVARMNGVGRWVRPLKSAGYRARAIGQRAPFGLVVANILARPLCRMAPALSRALAPAGVAVLSGLLAWEEAEVLAAHRAQGLGLLGRIALGGWRTLILSRRGGTGRS
ncbi:MAG: 50S ribosomal protein L11 methyltransferase [Proteobacteria bacterium]|nr:50S ribosomal protein L11 methyltransferase [Pseudomonadota bacterium]